MPTSLRAIAEKASTTGPVRKSPVRENCTPGSVRGRSGNWPTYLDGISMNTSQITIEYPEPFYSLFNTSRGDLPSIVVVNAKLSEFAHRDIFPWHLSVIIDARELAERGMPTHDECAILDSVGDEIEAAIVGNRNGLFLARETC